jgi:hypothetical protein
VEQNFQSQKENQRDHQSALHVEKSFHSPLTDMDLMDTDLMDLMDQLNALNVEKNYLNLNLNLDKVHLKNLLNALNVEKNLSLLIIKNSFNCWL